MSDGRLEHQLDQRARRAGRQGADEKSSARAVKAPGRPSPSKQQPPASPVASDPAIAAIKTKLAAADARLLADMNRIDQVHQAWARQRPARLTAPTAVRRALARQRRDVRELRLAVASVPAGPAAHRAKTLTVSSLELWEQGLAAWELSVTTRNTAKRDAADSDAARRLEQAEHTIASARRALGLPA